MNRQIPDEELSMILPTELVDVMPYGQISAIIRNQFCNPMVLHSKCTGKCNNCQPYLSDIFKRITTSSDIRDHRSIMVWHCRNTVAKIKEQKEVDDYKPPVDAFDRPLEINLFTQFISTFT